MSPTYRDDREAALSRAEALRRENARLHTENVWLRAQLDPDGVHPAVARAHRRGAAVGVALLLGALSCAVAIARDASSDAAQAGADLAYLDARELTPAPALGHAAARPVAPAAPSTEAPAREDPAVTSLALTPLLQGCFTGPRARADLLASVDARGRVRQSHVFVAGREPREMRTTRRCVRRAFASITLPTERAAYASYGPNAELHLVVLPAPRRRAPLR